MVTLLYSVLHLCSVPSGCRYTGERPEEDKKNADIEGKAGRVSKDRGCQRDVWVVGFFPPLYLVGKINAIVCILNTSLK